MLYNVATLNSAMFRVCFLPSLKHFVLKSIHVGGRTNPPDWFHLSLKELNPRDHLRGVGINPHKSNS